MAEDRVAASLLERGLRMLLDRLNGMLAGTVEWNDHDVETALWIANWWEVRRDA